MERATWSPLDQAVGGSSTMSTHLMPDDEDLLLLLRSLPPQCIDSDTDTPDTAESESLALRQWSKPPLSEATSSSEDSTETTQVVRRPAVMGTVKRRKVEMEKLHTAEQKLRTRLAQLKAAADEEARIETGTALSSREKKKAILQKKKAEREAMGRQVAVRENNGLRVALQRQIRITKSLQRLLQRRMRQETMKNAVALCSHHDLLATIAGNIRIRSDPVFDGLIVGLDEIYANVDRVFEKSGLDELPCPGRKNLSSRSHLKFVEFLDSYVVPFDAKSTARAVWRCLAEFDWKGPKNLASSYFDKTRNALLTYWVGSFSGDGVTIAIKNCRVTRKSYRPIVFYETMRLVVRANGLSELGPTAVIESHREASRHDKDDLNRIVAHVNEVGAVAWDAAVTLFNHRVEDAFLQGTRLHDTLP